MLTRRQVGCLRYVQGYTAAKGYAPSMAEIIAALGYSAKSTAHNLLIRLEQRGHIRRLPNRARAIEVIRPVPIPSINGTPLQFIEVKS